MDGFEKFTEGARMTLKIAQDEAQRFGHNYLDTEHILLGLIKEGGAGVSVLQSVSADPTRIVSALDFIVARVPQTTNGTGVTPRAQRVLKLAFDEARKLKQPYVGTEHLLLGLLREGEGIAAGVLKSMGITIEQLRQPVSNKAGSAYEGRHEVERSSFLDDDPDLRFHKFTERTLKALQLARDEAKKYGHNAIGPEHIFFGLLGEGNGLAARILQHLGISSVAYSMLEHLMPQNPEAESQEPSLTEVGKQVLIYAREEAQVLHQNYVATEHILLGLLRQHDGVVANFLESMHISADKVREEIMGVLSASGRSGDVRAFSPSGRLVKRIDPGAASSTEPAIMFRFDSFTEDARKTLQLAADEAWRFSHNYIGTEHILLGLARQQDGVAAVVLGNLGIDLQKVRSAVEFIIGRGDGVVMGEIGLTPGAKRTIELAVDEARRLNHHYIGTEHLLLGLVREGEGIAAGVLESLGVTLTTAKSEVMKMLGDSGKVVESTSPEVVGGSATTNAGVSIEMLKTMFDYLVWARDQLLPLIYGLEAGALKDVPADLQGGLYGSIHDTLAHMAQSEWLWVQRCLGESPMRLPKGEDFADVAAIVTWWNGVHADAVQLLNVISEAELQSEITYLAPDGKRRTRKIWHMLLQVPNHQTEHRAQLATMLGSLGLQVPPTDMVVYFSELGG